MKSIHLLLLFCLSAFNAFSQANFMWSGRIGGTGADAGWAAATDNSGNIYTTGFFTGTVDFDPSGGVSHLVSSGLEDIFVCKMNSSGSLVWSRSVGGPDGDRGFSISTDASGNVYVTGAFVGTVDFDPGAGTLNLSSASTYGDMYVLKLDSGGNLVWARQYGGSGGISGYSIAVDAYGNVLTTGSFTGTIDFDPGAGSYNLTNTGSYDIFVSKTSASGNFMWAKQMGGISGFEDNISTAIAVDAAGNVYTTGAYEDTTDFDPGAGYFPLDSTGMFISKLDASGNFAWAKKIVTQNGLANAMTVDNSGNLLLTGSFSYSADFDPGAGTLMLSSPASRDVFILKLNAAGNLIWVKQMGSSSGGDYAYAIKTDAAGNIYSAGSFNDIADMDPGAGNYDLTSAGMDDIFISKLDASGNFICAARVGGTDVDYAYGLALDAGNNIFLTGAFMNTADFDPSGGSSVHTSAGLEDIFVSAISDCTFSVGIPENKAQVVQVYPNPAGNTLFVSGDFNRLELFDATGKALTVNGSSKQIDLSKLGKGIYLLRIWQGTEQSTQRFIKE